MAHPQAQIDELRPYCAKLGALLEGGVTFYLLEGLRLPDGCDPRACDALLCSVPRDGYPSRLFLSVKVRCPFERNWNCVDARIGERNWLAFSWKFEANNMTLVQMLRGHLLGFTKEK